MICTITLTVTLTLTKSKSPQHKTNQSQKGNYIIKPSYIDIYFRFSVHFILLEKFTTENQNELPLLTCNNCDLPLYLWWKSKKVYNIYVANRSIGNLTELYYLRQKQKREPFVKEIHWSDNYFWRKTHSRLYKWHNYLSKKENNYFSYFYKQKLLKK